MRIASCTLMGRSLQASPFLRHTLASALAAVSGPGGMPWKRAMIEIVDGPTFANAAPAENVDGPADARPCVGRMALA